MIHSPLHMLIPVRERFRSRIEELSGYIIPYILCVRSGDVDVESMSGKGKHAVLNVNLRATRHKHTDIHFILTLKATQML